VASLIYLTTHAPPFRFAQEVTRAGHRVFEAQAVSEVLSVCEREWIDAIVIGADVEDSDVVEAQLRHITIRLKPEATAKELIWELSNLFPSSESIVL
jgi:hypothetical protein